MQSDKAKLRLRFDQLQRGQGREAVNARVMRPRRYVIMTSKLHEPASQNLLYLFECLQMNSNQDVGLRIHILFYIKHDGELYSALRVVLGSTDQLLETSALARTSSLLIYLRS